MSKRIFLLNKTLIHREKKRVVSVSQKHHALHKHLNKSCLTEEDIAPLQEEDVDTEPYTSDHSHFVDIDGTAFVPLTPKIHAAPDFGSYDVTGFKQFEQYLAKNGKKQPKAESVITQEILKKYAKEIKEAKLEEFRSFLDFTAMTFRDKETS